jgi:hypothetical protein
MSVSMIIHLTITFLTEQIVTPFKNNLETVKKGKGKCRFWKIEGIQLFYEIIVKQGV